MAEKFKQETSAEKLNSFLSRNRKVILTIFFVALLAVIAIAACVVINAKNTEKGLAQIDTISYALTQDAASLEGDALVARQDEALASLAALTNKGGIVGTRANLLAGDLYFQKKDYENAKNAWLKAAEANKNAYTAPLAYYNAASAAENLADLDSALTYYQKAADTKDFLLVDHARFSVARVYEAKQDFKAAAEIYNKLNDENPNSEWAAVAKTRLIALKANGSIE